MLSAFVYKIRKNVNFDRTEAQILFTFIITTLYRLRKSYTKSRCRGDAFREAEQYRAAKNELKHAIDDSKTKTREELHEDVNKNP